MPANRTNYLVLYKTESQVYGSGTKEIALSSPPPDGLGLEDKRVLFVTYRPDDEILSIHRVPQEEVLQAEIKYPKSKKKKEE